MKENNAGNKEKPVRACMTKEQIEAAIKDDLLQCVVEAQSDGTICWDVSESREREPIHTVKKGERFWCWHFKELGERSYTHDYANMGPTNVSVQTDVELELVYMTDDCDDPVLFDTELGKSPNIT